MTVDVILHTGYRVEKGFCEHVNFSLDGIVDGLLDDAVELLNQTVHLRSLGRVPLFDGCLFDHVPDRIPENHHELGIFQ